jgi:hypothetical protein
MPGHDRSEYAVAKIIDFVVLTRPTLKVSKRGCVVCQEHIGLPHLGNSNLVEVSQQ